MTPILPPDEPPDRRPDAPDAWYRRGWTYSNRPYGGCGCFYYDCEHDTASTDLTDL